MEFIKALHNVINKQKRKTGTRAYFANGEVYFSRLFGYRLVAGRYEPDERFSRAIKKIYDLLSEGKSLPEIKVILDEMKVRDSSNNKYSISRIVAIAERPVYAAHLYQRGRLVRIKNLTPIVSLEAWKRAQLLLKFERKRLVS